MSHGVARRRAEITSTRRGTATLTRRWKSRVTARGARTKSSLPNHGYSPKKKSDQKRRIGAGMGTKTRKPRMAVAAIATRSSEGESVAGRA
jgi:hypothetical protein